ncbi:hypothetical protein SPI_04400 [Niveomyces insectorum RCEF 264]|uniref:Uncharacterized protein n=1 Tax=Niveomyces insectorum RCEF 264 TaxID=1081102 RepID=A0A167VPR8_9HYPO|nr:hypothetical protein SPI_04400 [Niveomyces insectorum RCEF 264]
MSAPEPDGFTDEERALFAKLRIGEAGGLPLPEFIRPSQVVANTQPLAVAIFADWDALQRLVRPHAAQLWARWKQLKKKKRRAVLLDAWLRAAEASGSPATALPAPHRPDLAAWRRRERAIQKKEVEPNSPWSDDDVAAFLWPHLSLDDLADQPRLLWQLARARAWPAPDTFAAADLADTSLGKACLALRPRYLNQYSMLFSGRTTASAYGQLYTWDELQAKKEVEKKSGDNDDDDDDNGKLRAAAKDEKNGDNENSKDGEKDKHDNADEEMEDTFELRGTHPGEGLWILTIQARLYCFLHLAVAAVLGSEAVKQAQNTPELVYSDSGGGTGDGQDLSTVAGLGYSDTLAQSLEAPFGAPRTAVDLDLQTLLDLAYAKAIEAEDHVRAMRADPVYLRNTLQAWSAHRRERLQPEASTSGSPGHAAPAPPSAAPVADACLRRAFEQAETWHIVYAKVQLIAQQMEKHADAVAAARAQPPGGRLPHDVLLALYSLCHHLRSFENEPVGLLRVGAFASPPLRRYYRVRVEERKPKDDGGDSGKGGHDGSDDSETTLTVVPAEGVDAPPQLENTSSIVDDTNVDTEVVRDQTTAAILWALTGLQDDATRELLGRQTLLDELERALRWQREATARASGMSLSSPDETTTTTIVTPWVADQVATLALYAACARQLDRFQPWVGAYDRVLQQDATVRDILAMDFVKTMGRLRPLLANRLDGLEAVVAPFVSNESSRDGTTTAVDARNLAAFWVRVQQVLETNKALTPRLRTLLARPTPPPPTTPPTATAPENGKPPKRAVDKRAAKVFRALFHDAAARGSNTPAAVAWPDVVHALGAAGLDAVRLYASAWLFVPSTGVKPPTASTSNGTKQPGSPAPPTHPILFHEPWTASSKLTPAAARRMGERLNRAYGWDAWTFGTV